MKKKRLVILGAGSSHPLGLPSVRDVDQLMKRWAQEWATGRWGGQWDMPHGFANHFDALWRAADRYYQGGPTGPRPEPNFERVLGDMVALAHWMEPPPEGNALRQVTCNGGMPVGMTFIYREEPYGPTTELMSQLSYLLRRLAEHMRVLSRRIDFASDSAKRYRDMLGGLRKAFDLGVYNLNYDTAAVGALPGAFTGFSDETGGFEPRSVHERTAWDFVYHLHGSVHHSLNRLFGDEIHWRQSLDGEFFDGSEGRSSDKRSEGHSFPITALIAGGFKLDQLLVEPFQSFHASLVRHIYAADAILIGGYGFGDAHINRALRNRFNGGNIRLPVIVLDRACDKTDPMAFRSDLWAMELCRTLRTNGHFFAETGHSSPPVPPELAKRDAFEIGAQHRIALWHGGFVEAERRVSAIVQWLGGAADDVLVADSAK